MGRATVVLDIGKTISKISLWSDAGELLSSDRRANDVVTYRGRRVLDVDGIESWLAGALRRFAPLTDIGHIIPVGHGASAGIIRNGTLLFPPVDYEERVSDTTRGAYDTKRDAFAMTGSPALPNGLNLGIQLFGIKDDLTDSTQILLWPQYWAWKLSGVAASEVTSLGCHTDLWYPREGSFSGLAESMGWAERFPPLRTAGEALGPITAEWAARTGLPRDTQIHCGIHDSNAALQAARQFPEIRGREATILSTGTWFIAMRSPEAGAASPPLAEERDCLFNVDIHGRPIPSARFMGGREVEILGHLSEDRKALDALLRVVENRAMVLPTFAAGVGPFPQNVGLWLNKPEDDAARQVAIYLYAAMVANVSLNLIGAAGRILIEGRFARCETFVRALATLRPRDAIYTTDAGIDVSFGALCLLNEALQPPSPLLRVQPFDVDLTDYHADWSTHL